MIYNQKNKKKIPTVLFPDFFIPFAYHASSMFLSICSLNFATTECSCYFPAVSSMCRKSRANAHFFSFDPVKFSSAFLEFPTIFCSHTFLPIFSHPQLVLCVKCVNDPASCSRLYILITTVPWCYR